MKPRMLTILVLLFSTSLLALSLPTKSPAAVGNPPPSPTIQPTRLAESGHQRSEPEETIAARISTISDSLSVVIPATAQWTNTGIQLRPGDLLTITATGSWTPGPPESGMVGPDGSSRWWQDNFLNLADIGVCALCATTPTPHWAALIGYIGENPPGPGSYTSTSVITEARRIFVVGSDFVTNTVSAGILWLNFNDDAYSNMTNDNAGSVTGSVSMLWGGCPLAEVVSLRRLDDETLGIVGFVELDVYQGRRVVTATLRAVTGTMVIEAERDLKGLAAYNAPGGNPGAIPETAGLWSAALHREGGFPQTFTLILETGDSAGEVCREEREVLLQDSSWLIQTQAVDAPGEGNPAAAGITRIAGWSERSLGEPIAITLQLSRYQPNAASVGLPGTWDVVAEQTAPQGCWMWEIEVPASMVEPGENLYRVAAVLPEEGMEDLDGFYAVAGTENLTTDETLQRRQALVFRDTVRTVLAEDYPFRYPEALVAAIGAWESPPGNTTLGFDNGGVNSEGWWDGIMQVSCVSGLKGFSETGLYCQNNPNPPDYEATRHSIEFNVQDALLVLDEFYNCAVRHPRNVDPIYFAGTNTRDLMVMAVAQYNGGYRFYEACSQRQYLRRVAERLRPHPDRPDLSVAEFLADADYAPERWTVEGLVNRLEDGQDQCDNPPVP